MGIWEQLNTKTIGDLPSTDIQRQSNPIHLEEDNEEILRSVKLLNDVTLRDGLPIPNTSEIIVATATDSGNAVRVKLPNQGEVWQILNAHISTSGGSGSISHEFYFTDQTNSNSFMWYFLSSSGSNLTLQQDTDWTPPFYMDENLEFTYEATGTFTTTTLSIMMIRIR